MLIFHILVSLPNSAENNFSFYIIPTPDLKRILLKYADGKYGKRNTRKPQACWINRKKADYQAEWQEIATFKDNWDALNKVSK